MLGRFLIALIALIYLPLPVSGQSNDPELVGKKLSVSRVDPPNWWIGMKWNRLQLMLTGLHLNQAEIRFSDPQLRAQKLTYSKNGNHAFVEVVIPESLSAGDYKLQVTSKRGSAEIPFPIKERVQRPEAHRGFGPADIVYLITPDRFSNADTSNDRPDEIRKEFNPDNPAMRHGGDLRGIIERLDYLSDLGVTALWLNPILENRGRMSYHGYATTDHYRVDPRFGTNEQYRELVEKAHAKGLKIIFDHISNHIGIEHPWISSLPGEDWFNGSVESHLRQKHYMLSISDPHADPASTNMLRTFWFVDSMPDLNQQNPYLADYLIQNSLWWIEYSGIDGIREDTYPYADQKFMARWAKAILDEYPDFNIVGEIWAVHPAYLCQFQRESRLPRNFETNLPAIMDFPLMESWRRFLSGDGKLRDVYEVYAQDFLYSDLDNLMVFLDNHDISRAIFHAKDDFERFKVAMTVLFTARGIPQILYGTEIGMLGGASHIELRADFPGGFPGDTQNAFLPTDRTERQQAFFDFCKQLFQLRKKYPALSQGKMMHYAPTWRDDTYKIIKSWKDQKILIVANGNEKRTTVDLGELQHHFLNVEKVTDLQSGDSISWSEETRLALPAMTAKLYLLDAGNPGDN